jgi:hypothetical protein
MIGIAETALPTGHIGMVAIDRSGTRFGEGAGKRDATKGQAMGYPAAP